MHHRPARDGDGQSDRERLIGKRLADFLDQLAEHFVFKLAHVGVAIERDRVGPKHGLKIGGMAQSKPDISAAYSFQGLGRFGPSRRVIAERSDGITMLT